MLDKLIANLNPNTTPSQVFVAAIKARYGFDLKRFTDKNKEDRDTDDLNAKSRRRRPTPTCRSCMR